MLASELVEGHIRNHGSQVNIPRSIRLRISEMFGIPEGLPQPPAADPVNVRGRCEYCDRRKNRPTRFSYPTQETPKPTKIVGQNPRDRSEAISESEKRKKAASSSEDELSLSTHDDSSTSQAIIYFDYTIQLQLTMYSTPPNIIQWNCNGLQLHLPEIQLIKSRCNPTAFILQETHLRPEQSFRLRGFTSFRKDLNPDGRAKGGVAIFLRDSIHAQEIRINTRLQAVAIQIHSPRKLTLCSIYLPDYHWNMQEIQNILHQLPEPALIMGDFNAHSPLWGSETRDSRGRRIEILLEQENICLANPGSNTL
ncbi:hypothetical protein JTB14_029375 [Gonioctena quinquepunctata]|nr:hypothetical protein JTB14_029375 [Gonioctena quinquepunctata]